MADERKVRIDWFIADVAEVEVQVTEELIGSMISTAMQYLRVNGNVPWEKWSLLSTTSRMAFEAAAEQLKTRETVDVK